MSISRLFLRSNRFSASNHSPPEIFTARSHSCYPFSFILPWFINIHRLKPVASTHLRCDHLTFASWTHETNSVNTTCALLFLLLFTNTGESTPFRIRAKNREIALLCPAAAAAAVAAASCSLSTKFSLLSSTSSHLGERRSQLNPLLCCHSVRWQQQLILYRRALFTLIDVGIHAD